MMSIRELLSRRGCDWQRHAAPVSEGALNAVSLRIGILLPPGLLELYRLHDSGEGSLPFEPWVFVLWGSDEVAGLREHPFYREHYGNYLFFGGNGGGEYFGAETSGRIFMMDPIAGEESIVYVAESFDEFVANIGYKSHTDLPPTGK